MVVSYSEARQKFASICDYATDAREPMIIKRRGQEDVALIAADELKSLRETAYLLRSPANARRLIEALARSRRGENPPTTIDQIRAEFGLGAEEPTAE